MKHGIELNGLSNLHILIDKIEEGFGQGHPDADNAKEQLVLLERYMIAYAEAMNAGTKPPYWHEVRENPNLYPTNRERVGK